MCILIHAILLALALILTQYIDGTKSLNQLLLIFSDGRKKKFKSPELKNERDIEGRTFFFIIF